MSENRSRYSSAPLQDLRRRPPRQKQPPKQRGQAAAGIAAPNPRSYVFLQVLLVAALPVLFIVSLLVRDTRLYWAFVILSLAGIALMALLKAFVPNARRVLGVVHAAMIAVALFAILVSSPARGNPAQLQTQDLASIFSDETTASLTDMAQAAQDVDAVQTPDPGSASLAQQKLDRFMAAWANKDYAAMVSYSSPAWVNQHESQRDAETSIFHLSAIRTPVSYQITDVSGSDSDQTRTITMQALISKNDGKEPVKYNFQILMIRVNNEWFVDPNSISSSQVVQEAPVAQADSAAGQQAAMGQAALAEEAQQAQAQAQTVSVRSDTVLYYNQDGGEFYHIDPNCSSIGTRYRPLTAMFYYRDVSNDTFKNLKTCPECKAPAR